MAKPQPVSSAKQSLLDNLKQIRTESRKERRGHHQYIASAICKAFRIYLRLRADEEARKAFLVLAKVPASHHARANLTIEVLCYAVGRRTKVGQKEASKRARVLEYLHKSGVSIKRMPAVIRDRGGIQNVYNEAVKNYPRHRKGKKQADRAPSPTKKASAVGKGRYVEDDKMSGFRSVKSFGNDQLQRLQIDALTSDVDTLRDLAPGQTCRLRIQRCRNDAESRSLVRVLKVVPA